ncbi:MAG: FIST N-terminal domain-containing protein [Sulfuricellaceae bacterium]
MKIEQQYWTTGDGWQTEVASTLDGEATLVLVFGSVARLRDSAGMEAIRARYPGAQMVGCSTSGEICGTRVRDDSLSVTAVRFEHTAIKLVQVAIGETGGSREAGERLAKALPLQQLVHVLVLSDGLKVNGSELARGLRENLPEGVAVTGGLAGDGSAFQHTLVCADGIPAEGLVAALGFYSERLKIGYGSLGGWDSFGAERLITRAQGNVLYELDGRSALDLYKEYLGEHAAGLPATALLFPLALVTRGQRAEDRRQNESPQSLSSALNPQSSGTESPPQSLSSVLCPLSSVVVRTVLAVNEDEQSMTFAGDMPEGGYARLMKANFDRLVDGAAGAARAGYEMLGSVEPELALLVSCVGRKLVLKQRVEEEVESVREVLGEHTVLTGFYSYGEICPHDVLTGCELHNQTMTITTFSER